MRAWIIWAALYGCTGVLMGAFGAHALKARLSPDALASFETGVRYQLIHAVLLMVLALLMHMHPSALLKASGTCLVGGLLLFSGSIYLLATRDVTGFSSWRWLGPVTPLGGMLMIAGWLLLLVWAIRFKK